LTKKEIFEKKSVKLQVQNKTFSCLFVFLFFIFLAIIDSAYTGIYIKISGKAR